MFSFGKEGIPMEGEPKRWKYTFGPGKCWLGGLVRSGSVAEAQFMIIGSKKIIS